MLGFRRLRCPAARDVLDVIAAARNEASHAFGPEGRHDAGRPAAPVVTRHHRASNRERIHQGQEVVAEHRLLSGARRIGGEKAGRAIAAQIGSDDAAAASNQQRRHVVERMDVVRKPVQENDRRAVGGPGLLVGDLENAGRDMSQHALAFDIGRLPAAILSFSV
jgi:hypothetical protein